MGTAAHWGLKSHWASRGHAHKAGREPHQQASGAWGAATLFPALLPAPQRKEQVVPEGPHISGCGLLRVPAGCAPEWPGGRGSASYPFLARPGGCGTAGPTAKGEARGGAVRLGAAGGQACTQGRIELAATRGLAREPSPHSGQGRES